MLKEKRRDRPSPIQVQEFLSGLYYKLFPQVKAFEDRLMEMTVIVKDDEVVSIRKLLDMSKGLQVDFTNDDFNVYCLNPKVKECLLTHKKSLPPNFSLQFTKRIKQEELANQLQGICSSLPAEEKLVIEKLQGVLRGKAVTLTNEDIRVCCKQSSVLGCLNNDRQILPSLLVNYLQFIDQLIGLNVSSEKKNLIIKLLDIFRGGKNNLTKEEIKICCRDERIFKVLRQGLTWLPETLAVYVEFPGKLKKMSVESASANSESPLVLAALKKLNEAMDGDVVDFTDADIRFYKENPVIKSIFEKCQMFLPQFDEAVISNRAAPDLKVSQDPDAKSDKQLIALGNVRDHKQPLGAAAAAPVKAVAPALPVWVDEKYLQLTNKQYKQIQQMLEDQPPGRYSKILFKSIGVNCGVVKDERGDIFVIYREGDLECYLGKGGFGAVKLVRCPKTGEVQALKTIQLNANVDFASAMKELWRLNDLGHSRQTRLFSQKSRKKYKVEKVSFLMRYASGSTVHEILTDNSRPVSYKERLIMAIKIFDEYYFGMFLKGFLHRDIKRENFMYDLLLGIAAVIDLGFMVRYNPITKAYDDENILGTPALLAPELLCGQSPYHYSEKSEVFALGWSLREILLGQFPEIRLHGKKFIRTCGNFETPPPAPEGVGVDIAQKLAQTKLLDRMVAEKPDARPTLKEIHDFLHLIKFVLDLEALCVGADPKTQLAIKQLYPILLQQSDDVLFDSSYDTYPPLAKLLQDNKEFLPKDFLVRPRAIARAQDELAAIKAEFEKMPQSISSSSPFHLSRLQERNAIEALQMILKKVSHKLNGQLSDADVDVINQNPKLKDFVEKNKNLFAGRFPGAAVQMVCAAK